MNRESATISASTAAACNAQLVSICTGFLQVQQMQQRDEERTLPFGEPANPPFSVL